MTRSEIIQALNHHGGKATSQQIKTYLKSQGHSGYFQHVAERMLKWKELSRTLDVTTVRGGSQYLWELKL